MASLRLMIVINHGLEPRAPLPDTEYTECGTRYTTGTAVYTVVYPGWYSGHIHHGRYTSLYTLGYTPVTHPGIYTLCHTPGLHVGEAQRGASSPLFFGKKRHNEARLLLFLCVRYGHNEARLLLILWEK